MSEENKKTNFFKEVFKSIKDLDKYEDFALELPKTAFKYFTKLVLLFTAIITIFYSYKIVDSLNDIYVSLKNKLPEFSYAQGILKFESEEPIILEEYKETIGKIIIDTNIEDSESDKYEKEIKNNTLGLLILKDKCVVLSNGTMGQVTYKYSDIASGYNITEFTKQDVVNYIDSMNVISIYASIYFVIFVYLFIIYFMAILLDVLILSILAYIVARISRIKLKFAPSFNIAVHSITLPVLLNLIYIVVNLLTGFNIKYFQIMYNTISYIYIIVAVLMIKTDFINRQLELMKLAEEQEKIREEMRKKKEEEEKEKQEKEKQEKKPEGKKDKERKKKEDDGEIEGGVNPSVIKEEQ